MSVPGSCRRSTACREAAWSASDSTGTPGWVLRNASRRRSFSRSARVSDMLGGFRRGPRGAVRREQLGLLFLRLVQVAALDVPEAANAIGNGRNLHRESVIAVIEPLEQPGHG